MSCAGSTPWSRWPCVWLRPRRAGGSRWQIGSALLPEWIPAPWRATIWPELEAAREAASEPLPMREVEDVLRIAWNAEPTDELDELDSRPAAVTPTSQVHRGVLDGDPVAVKVLRPGLAAGVRQDLTLLEGLVGPLRLAFPALDPQATLGEVRERVLDELDLEHEAGMQRRFQRALRGHAELVVPGPITRLSHENVLVSQWIEGRPFSEADDLDRAAARLVVFVVGGVQAGLVHADPDPQDVLELSDGRLAVLDYGATRTVDRARAARSLDLVEAFAAGDAAALGSALEALGTLPAAHGESALAFARAALGDLGRPGPSRLDSREVVNVGRRVGERPELALELAMSGSLPPEDLWPLRGIGLAFAMVARCGATGPWLELTLAALRDGWDAAV